MRTPIRSGKEICHNCPSVLHQLRSSRIVLSTFSASLTTVPPYQISCSEWCRSVAHLLWYTFMGSSLVLLYNHTSTFPFLFNKIHVPCLLTFFLEGNCPPETPTTRPNLLHSPVPCRKTNEAKTLNIPLFGTDTQGAFWGTKTGNRQVFRVPWSELLGAL